jgi:hypothetical protein
MLRPPSKPPPPGVASHSLRTTALGNFTGPQGRYSHFWNTDLVKTALFSGSVKRHVGGAVFCAVRIVSNDSRRLVRPRTSCFSPQLL